MIFKRGKKGTYYIKFMWQGRAVFRSARTTNPRVARQVEAATRNALAKGDAGIFERKPAPTLAEFASKQFLPWAEATFAAKPKTWLWYRNGARRLLSRLGDVKLDALHGEQIASYVAHRQSRGLQVSSVNRELQVLRRMLHLAVEWGVIEQAPKVKLLTGERHREFVLTPKEEAKYLAIASEPLASVATILADTGMRPEECYRLRWEFVAWMNGRHGTLLVTHGKTAAARRALPMTPRVRAVLEDRWERAGRPLEGWIWPSGTKSGHIEPCTLKKQHAKALRLSEVRPFVLYNLRHTFLTRLGASGCDVWTLARIAGHSSVAMSARYVHPSEDAVLAAMEKLTATGCENGSSPEEQLAQASSGKVLTA